MPMTAKGTNVFHASQAVTGADGDLDDQGSSSGNANEDRPQTPNDDAPAHDTVLDAELAQNWSTTPPPA